MNETAAFELEVRNAVARQLPRLGVKAECVFRNKSYPSKNAGSSIEADLAIEIAAGEGKPPLLWIWECKDFSRPVGVEDVESFCAKLQDINAGDIRGTIVSRSPFTKAALEYSRAHSIGAARFTPQQRTDANPAEPRSHEEDVLGADEWSFLWASISVVFRHWFVDWSSGLSPEDLTQETLLRLFKKLREETLIVDLRAYALGIAQNVRHDNLRKAAARDRRVSIQGLPPYEEPETGTSFSASPQSDDWQVLESKIEVERWLLEIPEMDRKVVLSLYNGETLDSVAKQLRLTTRSLRTHLRRIGSRLAEMRGAKPGPIIKKADATSYASAQLAAAIIAGAARSRKRIPDDIWEEIKALPSFAIDRTSFVVAGNDVIFMARLRKTEGEETDIWVRVSPASRANGAGQERSSREPMDPDGTGRSIVVFGGSRDDVMPAGKKSK
jgi:RNA polymerase sigma factor (sigma-70 family)